MSEPTAIMRKSPTPRSASGRTVSSKAPITAPGRLPSPPTTTMARMLIELAELELVGTDEIRGVRQQRTSDPGEEAARAERDNLQLSDVEAHGAGALVVLADGA